VSQVITADVKEPKFFAAIFAMIGVNEAGAG
jgi:hypothetical protein